MSDQQFQNAAREAQKLLLLYSANKLPRFALEESEILQPGLRIEQALNTAQFILNETSKTALESRVQALAKMRNLQRYANILHFITGSAFVLLIAGHFEKQTKWIGA